MYFIRPPYLLKKIYAGAIWRMPPGEKTLYLTFDDGPIPEVTPWVLENLKTFNAPSTFFCVGNNVQKYPEIYKQILNENHAVGNHTFNHINGWKTNTPEYIDNIDKCKDFAATDLFRPPYGKLKRDQLQIINTQFSIIMWDVLSGDYDKNTSKEQCLKNVLNNTREGSIVVFHDSLKARDNLYYTLPRFLEHFALKGYSFKALGKH